MPDRAGTAPLTLVLDWDGTVTEVDTLHMALEEFGDPDLYARAEEALADGSMSYRELMEVEMATIGVPVGEVRDWLLRHARIRRGLRELTARGPAVILSSGFHELIEPLLAREGITADVRANRLDEQPGGWQVLWRDPEPCPDCGDLCKRRTLPPGPVAYVGDGYSDQCAALAAERVFARDSLASYLDEVGAPYEPFDDLVDVCRALDRASPGAGQRGRLESRRTEEGRT